VATDLVWAIVVLTRDKKKTAVINSRANRGMDHCSHGGCGNRFAYGSKVPELVVRGAH